jgi:hypothetical protein
MAEFSFHVVWADVVRCLSRIIALDRYSFTIRMSNKYNRPSLFTAINDDDLAMIQKGYPLLILVRESEPIWAFIGSENEPGYMIDTNKSGPLLELFLPHGKEKEETLYLYAGWLNYPSKVIDPKTLKATSAPEYIRQEYRLIQKQLKKELKKYYFLAHQQDRNGKLISRRVPLWIGLNALELLKHGKAVIPFGKDVIRISNLHESIRVKSPRS